MPLTLHGNENNSNGGAPLSCIIRFYPKFFLSFRAEEHRLRFRRFLFWFWTLLTLPSLLLVAAIAIFLPPEFGLGPKMVAMEIGFLIGGLWGVMGLLGRDSLQFRRLAALGMISCVSLACVLDGGLPFSQNPTINMAFSIGFMLYMWGGMVLIWYVMRPPSCSYITTHGAKHFANHMRRRRSARAYAREPVPPREAIEQCLLAAGASPSGANQQPWRFVVVSDPEVKSRIRQASEDAERRFYERSATEEFLEATDALELDRLKKPFLDDAPYLIIVFALDHGVGPDGKPIKHYYPTESASIALGVLIAAIHQAGLVTLPYTPAPMRFLNEILGRPKNERPLAILPVGYPAPGSTVPDIGKKPLEEIAEFI